MENTLNLTRILISGKNSYIGQAAATWLKQWPNLYAVDFIGTRNNEWQEISFAGYDVVLHVAGIAHQDTKADQEALYYSVNRDLTIAIAEKAKNDGVKQFIFLSSMIVYGASSNFNEDKIITKETVPMPVNFYGKSKLQAEEGILKMQTEKFNVAVIRPPMIYGKNSKGNYPIMAKFAKKLPLFPDIKNRRSMLYIDNLTEFIRLIIKNNEQGIYFPQNAEYVTTSNMVKVISDSANKKIILTKIFNPIIGLLGRKITLINKIFGNSAYDLSMSIYKENYRVSDFKESIRLSENKK
ncbi:MAG: hypothetical protein PWR19_1981 [Carnobacterium sp.]|nr:hypothetical protein [Carnobacterium sp.]